MSKPDWKEYFLNIAEVVATRSPDPKKHVGCVLVKNNRIISTGYNGLPSGLDESIDWNDRDTVKHLIIHAETNCLIYSNCIIDSTCVLYSTLSPCSECLKLIAATGIKTVYYREQYRLFDDVVNTSNLLGIELIQL